MSAYTPEKKGITAEPTANHIHCDTKGNILMYRDLVKKYAPVWTNSMFNGIVRLSQE